MLTPLERTRGPAIGEQMVAKLEVTEAPFQVTGKPTCQDLRLIADKSDAVMRPLPDREAIEVVCKLYKP